MIELEGGVAGDEPLPARAKLGLDKTGKLPPLPPGTLVDHFQVVRCLGRGGMGVVYLARDAKLGRKVALKVIDPALARSPDAVSMFLREARATARFNHPNIVTIHGVGQHGVSPYIALEYLEGQTLRERLGEGERRMGAREGIRIGLAIAEALREAHAHNLVHGDLKPDNVIIPADGRPRVVDFGICRVMTAGPEEASQGTGQDPRPPAREEPIGDPWGTTVVWLEPIERCGNRARPALGTPAFMAPEQWLGERVTGAADIWAMGLILGDLVAGWHPYNEVMDGWKPGSVYLLRQAVLGPDPPPEWPAPVGEAIPDEVGRVIRACLQKDPAARPEAAEIADRLAEFLDDNAPSPAAAAPFPGLRPFVEQEARFYTGLETEVAAFVERVRTEAILPVIGPSGVGKSSFVRAGAIPRLKEQGSWLVIELRPGSDPFAALVEAVVAAGGAEGKDRGLWSQLMASPPLLSLKLRSLARQRGCRVLLFVDQLEEAVTKVADPLVRHSFIEALCSAADDREDPVRVILALRDDALTRLAQSPRAREVFGRVTVLARPDATALERIVNGPLEAAGYEYDDPQLPAEMIGTVLGEPACLPLLQFTARKLWERRDRRSRTLQRSVYDAFGGVGGALAAHADGVLEGLSPGQRGVTRQLLLRLVSPEGTRQSVRKDELLQGLEGEEPAQVLDRLVEARVVSVKLEDRGGAEVELIHESLIHSWSRLSGWITEGQEDLRFVNDVTRAANLWLARGAPPDEVWGREALHTVERSLERCSLPVPEQVGRFLDACRRNEQTRRRRRRLMTLLAAGLLTLVAAAAVVAVMAVVEGSRRARREADHALRRWAEAQREGARAALARGDLLEARAKLRGSLEKGDSSAARVLWRRLRRHPLLWARHLGTIIYDVSVSPDGQSVAAATQDRTVYLADLRTGHLRALRGHRDQVFAVAHSPDGRWIASGSLAGEVRVWDRGGQVRHRLEAGTPVRALSFGPRGRRLCAGGNDGKVRVWELGRRSPRVLGLLPGSVEALAFAPDGGRLAAGGEQGIVRIFRPGCRRCGPPATLRVGAAIHGLSFSPDGRRLASAAGDGVVRLFAGSSGKPALSVGPQGRPVRRVSFSPDGETLALASQGGGVRLHCARTGRLLRVLPQVAGALGVAFGPRGRLLASGGVDQTLRLWDTSHRVREVEAGAHRQAVNTVSFSADGRLLATGGVDRTVRIWSVASGMPLRTLDGHRDIVYRVAFSPDGRLLASASWDETVRLWDVASGVQRQVLDGHQSAVLDVAFSPDGQLLISGGRDGTARIWQVPSGTLVHKLVHEGPVIGVAFGPNGEAATTSYDGKLRLWEPNATRPVAVVDHRVRPHGVTFSPGGLLVTSGWDGAVRLWDRRGLSHRVVGRHQGRAYRVRFVPSPDGVDRLLGSVGADGSARIRSLAVAAGGELTFSDHRGEVNDLAFGPSGKLAATAGDDGTVRLWRTDTGRSVWRAVALIGASGLLTHRGWQTLGRSRSCGQRCRRALEHQDTLLAVAYPSDPVLCRLTGEGLELWDLRQDRRVASQSLPADARLLALPGGCASQSGAVVRLHRAGRGACILHGQATAVAWDGETLLVAGDERIAFHDREGAVARAPEPAPPDVKAVAGGDGWLAFGMVGGSVEIRRRDGRSIRLQDTPSSTVVSLQPLRDELLVAGFASGVVGLWSIRDGAALERAWLHGPVRHLVQSKGRLHAVSELGQHLTWDLTSLRQPYCDLLREIWTAVPVVWESGAAGARTPPTGHPCNNPSR
jgi:WD40 repeat protein/serine/threonine protein kinase